MWRDEVAVDAHMLCALGGFVWQAVATLIRLACEADLIQNAARLVDCM